MHYEELSKVKSVGFHHVTDYINFLQKMLKKSFTKGFSSVILTEPSMSYTVMKVLSLG